MRKLIITLTLTTIALAASAERVKSTFNIFDGEVELIILSLIGRER